MQDIIEKKLNKLMLKAFSKDEVPVAAILVKNNKIISKAYNKRVSSNNPLNHAEIQCIIKAAKKLKDWRLNDCDMYVTLEPCHMCREIIKECRINNVYFYTINNKNKNYKTKFRKLDNNKVFIKKCEELLTIFFKNKR